MVVTTTETNEVSINVRFEASKSTWLALGGAAALLVAAILASVTLGIGWGTYETSLSGSFGGQDVGGSNEASYKLFEIEGGGGSLEYSDSELDGRDGIGLLRAAGPLAVVAVVLGFLAPLVVAASVFVQGFHLRLIGGIVAALAVVFLLLTVILFPIGVSDFHQATSGEQGGMTFETTEVAWGAGLILAIIGTLAAIGGTALGFLSLRKETA